MLATSVKASHIAGGEITYKYLGNNQYQVHVDFYVDCINGIEQAIATDSVMYLAGWSGSTNSFLSNIFPLRVSRKGPEKVVKVAYSCLEIGPNACVNHYWYDIVVTLPPRTGGYILAFERCCRNRTISNLFKPEATGDIFWTQVPDPRTLPDTKHNNSAVFKELPPNFICNNTLLKFDHSAVDADGDSLVYDFYWPYGGTSSTTVYPTNQFEFINPPFPRITYTSIYNAQYPLDANPKLNIDSKTGYLTVYPTSTGQFVVGIRVREYRKGMFVSETLRDYQFNVQECIINVVASYYSPAFVCGYDYQFINQSNGATRYHWDFGVPGNADTSILTRPKFTFPGPGKYRVSLLAFKNNCVDSFVQFLEVVAPQIPSLPNDTIICPGRSVQYTSDISGDYYRWSTGAVTKSISINTTGIYWLEVTNKTCNWRDTVEVTIDQNRVDGIGDTVYCSENSYSRQLQATKGMYNYQWSTGSVKDTTMVSQAGKYIISAETLYGCPSKDTVWVQQFPPISLAVSDTIVCPTVAVNFSVGQQGDLINWSNGSSENSTTITNPGNYSVTITRGLCVKSDNFQLSNYPSEFELGPDLRYCNLIDTILDLSNKGYSNITWRNEIQGEKYRLLKPGKLDVTLLNSNACPESDFLNVLFFPNPALNLGRDTTVCLSINPVLDAGPGMVAYLWQNGSKEQKVTAYDAGLYHVRITDKEGCHSTDTIVIGKNPSIFPSLVYMPTAFTPDGNGTNDFYPDNKYVSIGTFYSVVLYNRWGEKLADFNSPTLNWDGNINGKQAPEGVYVYLVSWIGCDNERHKLTGSFHLLR